MNAPIRSRVLLSGSVAMLVAARLFATEDPVAPQPVPASFRLPEPSVGPLAPGFRVKTVQAGGPLPDSLYRAEAQLAGLLSTNRANLSNPDAEGYVTEVNVINYGLEPDGHAGNFAHDAVFPGIPGGRPPLLTNYFACGIVALLQFPTAGTYQMGVNSDDSFRLSIGHPQDVAPLVLGQSDGPREAADTSFRFVVPEPGLYPFHLIYEHGQGNASLEWFGLTVTPVGPQPQRVLVNSETAGSLAAYQYLPDRARPPSVKSMAPSPGATRVGHRRAIEVTLVDGTLVAVDTNTIQLAVDDVAVQPDMTRTNGETTVRWVPPSPYAPNTNHTAALSFADRTVRWSFATTNVPYASFFIEAEDFDYDGGQHLPAASRMPYAGGAYTNLGSVFGVDYRTSDLLPDFYREPESPNVPMGLTSDRGRVLGEPRVNFMVGTIELAEDGRPGWTQNMNAQGEYLLWLRHTRVFPDGDYHVYAALSRTNLNQPMQGLLWRMGAAPQTQDVLGTFWAAGGSGAWGHNLLAPLWPTAGPPPPGTLAAVVHLSGTNTLQYVPLGEAGESPANLDFLFFTRVGPAPRFTSYAAQNGSISLEWNGSDTRLESAPTVTGPWRTVPRATGSWYFIQPTDTLPPLTGVTLDPRAFGYPQATTFFRASIDVPQAKDR